MSTRATYKFTGGKLPAVTVYIHHDGYPNGAAWYFWNMHHDKGRDSANLARFIRANDRAELTPDHDAHGDTEWRYTLDGETLTVHRRNLRDIGVPRWAVFFVGNLYEFINVHGADKRSFWPDEFSPIRDMDTGHYMTRRAWLSRKQITERLAEATKKHDEYKANHPEWIGNIRGMASEVETWTRVLAEYDAAQAFETEQTASG